jgi:hypothetical protein
MQQRCGDFCRTLAQRWFKGVEYFSAAGDWSDLTADQGIQLSRASLAMDGRNLTLYRTTVHTSKRLGNSSVQRLIGERALHNRQFMLMTWRHICGETSRSVAYDSIPRRNSDTSASTSLLPP